MSKKERVVVESESEDDSMEEESGEMSQSEDSQNDSQQDYGSSEDVPAGKRFIQDAASESGGSYDDEESLEELDDEEGQESSIKSAL